jgi:hypothetical protein
MMAGNVQSGHPKVEKERSGSFFAANAAMGPASVRPPSRLAPVFKNALREEWSAMAMCFGLPI